MSTVSEVALELHDARDAEQVDSAAAFAAEVDVQLERELLHAFKLVDAVERDELHVVRDPPHVL